MTHNGITYIKNGKKWKYKLTKAYRVGLPNRLHGINIRHEYVRIIGGTMVAKTGYAWDGATCWPDFDSIMRGSLVHDIFYQLIREGLMARYYRKDADKLLRQMCLEDGMMPFHAWLVYTGVRLFARAKKGKK